jgi:hypothetical protein
MCLICVEFDKGRMTLREARRALPEMSVKLGPKHVAEVEALLDALENPQPAPPAQPPAP